MPSVRYHVKAPFEKPIRLLTSVPGIGVTTAVTLMVELDDIVCFRNADHRSGTHVPFER